MPTPNFQAYVPGVNDDIETQLKEIKNHLIEAAQYNQWLMSHLDDKNVIRAKSVSADWVYAGNIKAIQIDVAEGKIQAAQIETLTVGDNVQMGPDAHIAWDKITGDKPPIDADNTWQSIGADRLTYIDGRGIYTGTLTAQQINVIQGIELGANASIHWGELPNLPSAAQIGALPSNTYIPPEYTDARALAAWEASNYATYIDANGVYSGSFNGGMFNVNPTGSPTLPSGITIGGWWDNYWKGQALKIKFEEEGDGGWPGTVFSSEGDVPIVFKTPVNFENSVVYFNGSTVYGLNVIAKLG